MDEETINEIDKLTFYMDMELYILHNALKYTEEKLDMVAVSYFVENIYKKSEEARKLF